MKFEKTYAMLNAEQKAAVDKINGPLLVIAGPGTGKTQLLSARVANILKKTDTNPENILCLTFTEAGASAMRARLNSFIGPAATRVSISTYHAFGADIIYLYNNFAEKVGRSLSAPIDPVRQHKIVTELRDRLKHNDILRNAKVSDLISSLAEVKTARLSSENLKKIAEINLLDSARINTVVSGVLGEIPKGAKFDKVLPYYENVRTALIGFAEKKPIVGKVERIGNGLLDSLNEAIESQIAAEKPSTGVMTKWRDAYFEKNEKNEFVLKNIVANKKLLSLANLLNLYDAYLVENELFDFADMIEESIRYLRENDAFRYSVQERYQYILLDEFQDTNDSQLELIRLVADYEQPNIMAVGDDDQAIFAFQGARYSNLMDFKETFGAEVVVLTINYRSGQPVIDLGGAVAGQIAERFADKYGLSKNLSSYAVSEGLTEADTTIKRVDFVSEPSEYSWVAGQIAELVIAGVPQKSIAVIAPKHKFLESLVPYFGGHPAIKLAYDKRENILESEQLSPLIKLARLVVKLSKVQPTAPDLLEILSFPFWEIPPIVAISAVHEIKEKKISALSYLQDAENEKLRELAEFFANLALKCLDTPLEIMLDYLLGTTVLGDFRSPYLEYYNRQGNLDTIRFYESLAVLREHILTYATKEKVRLSDLVNYADDYAAADMKLINTSPYEESSDAVRLLSAHGAKGLEFEYVFLISVDNKSWGTGKGNNNTLVLPKNLEFVRHSGATEDEKLRLFFVAITRAKYNLYLTASLKDFSGKEKPALKYLQEVDGVSPLLPEGARDIETISEEKPAMESLTANWAGRYSLRDVDLREIAAKNVENYRLSASDLTTYIDVIYGGPEALYMRRVLKSPQASSEAAEYGNLAHKVFDKITKEKSSDAEAVAYYQELVAEADIDDELRTELQEKGEDNLPIYLKERGDYLRGAGHFSEVSFYKDNLAIDGVPISGFIDHIVVDEAAKTIRIVDFKTGKYHAEKWESHPTLLKYKMQLQFYKLLLEASLKYKDYTVEAAEIDFVTPDENGRIWQKVLSFSEKDMAEFRILSKKVYQNIKALEFPDISDYEKTLRGMKEFIGSLLLP